MNYDPVLLRHIFSSGWKTTCCAWGYRKEVLGLIGDVQSLRAESAKVRDELHLAQLEIDHLKDRLAKEEVLNEKSKGHVNKLWQIIVRSHGIGDVNEEGSAIKVLQEARNK